jgi:RNA polymerase sigma-70 factor, ECF subfamily
VVGRAFEACSAELLAYVARSFGGGVDPEDVVQEAFVRLITETAAGRMPTQVRPWLYRVAHNIAVSELRRPTAVTRSLDEPPEPEPSTCSAEEEWEAATVDLDLRTSIRALAPAARRALLMAAEGYTGHEIARAVGRSDLAARALLWRSRRRLRESPSRGRSPMATPRALWPPDQPASGAGCRPCYTPPLPVGL